MKYRTGWMGLWLRAVTQPMPEMRSVVGPTELRGLPAAKAAGLIRDRLAAEWQERKAG